MALIYYNNPFLVFPPVLCYSRNHFPSSSSILAATFPLSSLLFYFGLFFASWLGGDGVRDTSVAMFAVIFQVNLIHKNCVGNELL